MMVMHLGIICAVHRDVTKPSTLGGGGCRHVLTNISWDFDHVVPNFPENVVDGREVKKISRLT